MEEGSSSSNSEQSEDAAIETFDAQINEYSYGVRVVDACYLEPSSTGTHLLSQLNSSTSRSPPPGAFVVIPTHTLPCHTMCWKSLKHVVTFLKMNSSKTMTDVLCLLKYPRVVQHDVRSSFFRRENFESVDRMVVKSDVRVRHCSVGLSQRDEPCALAYVCTRSLDSCSSSNAKHSAG